MMSIRLRLTLLYSAILALTLVVFGLALYTVQAETTLGALRRDLDLSSEKLVRSLVWRYRHPPPPGPAPQRPSSITPDMLSEDQAFRDTREQDIVRVLDPNGDLVASPFRKGQAALPLSAVGLQKLHDQQPWWEIAVPADERLLIYNKPVVADDKLIYIVQVARSLAERDRSLAALASTLLVASLLTVLLAFGIGWALAGTTLRPIHRITQTAQAIGSESDFTHRVDYHGPNDEIGQLATTFNSMLARLQDAYQRVSQALKMQRDFVADVSHELRTPLTTVRGNLALLRRSPPPPPDEQADILSDLVDESDRMIRLVNDLLVLARADAGRSLRQEPLSIRPLVEEACRQARQLDRQRVVAGEVQDLVAMCDRDALKQVLLILLDNALKHTQGVVQVSAQALDGWAMIYVLDQGPGMDALTLEHVFDRFYRGADGSGFGLGLSIARTLVEEQGGTISLESGLASGTCACIRLSQASAEGE